MDPSKILVDKNRVRFNACSILDVVQFEANRPMDELQQEDFIHLGKLVLQLANNNLNATPAMKSAIDNLIRTYSTELRDVVTWLCTPAVAPATKSIDEFLRGISSHFVTAFDSSLHANDSLTSHLARELENGRIARLVLKLGTINERPEYEGDAKWSEIGERYILKLFRDHVFHQVNAEGKPVVDLAHMLTNLNKLDAGTEEIVRLVSRDEQDVFFVKYKELKSQVNKAFDELLAQGRSPAKGRY